MLEAVLSLPSVSVNVAPATEMEPVPDCVLVVGVNTTEYTVEEVVVSVPMVPPVTVMSLAANVEEASESVNVMVSVWPDFSDPEPDRAIKTVGPTVSYVMDSAVDAVLLFPGLSVNLAPATEMEPVPDCVLVVGVNTTEYTVEEVVVSAPMVPPVTVMSSAAKSVEASDSVNVIVSVWPDFSEPDPARVIVTVGAAVSTFCVESVLTAL